MRLLLDSHTVIWAADDPTQLSVLAQQLIQDPSHDRLMAAQALVEGIPLISADKSFDPYGVTRVWK